MVPIAASLQSTWISEQLYPLVFSARSLYDILDSVDTTRSSCFNYTYVKILKIMMTVLKMMIIMAVMMMSADDDDDDDGYDNNDCDDADDGL